MADNIPVDENGDIRVKNVMLAITAEVPEDATLDPADYRVEIRSTQDAYFDMIVTSVAIFPDLTVRTDIRGLPREVKPGEDPYRSDAQ